MIDKNRIRQRLQNIASKGGPTPYWSCPKDGKSTIRMFPYPYGEGDPFLEYFFHFNIGRASILCPVKNGLGSECPICDLANELYNSPEQQDKDISRKLYARSRYFATVLDRSDETMTGKYWGFSQGLLVKFSEWLQEDGGDYENFMDYENGLDLVVSFEKNTTKSFPAVVAEPKRRESPLAENKEQLKEILASVKRAQEIFKPLTVQEIKGKLNDWLNAEEPQRSGVQGKEKDEEEKEVVKPKRSVTKDVEEVFAENFPND